MTRFRQHQIECAESAERAAAKQPLGSTLRFVYENAAKAHRRMAATYKTAREAAQSA